MQINIKPLSVNECWKWRRYKTNQYIAYEARLLKIYLDEITWIDFKKPLSIDFIFWLSKSSDIDNPLKPLIDILQKRYWFNDNQIMSITVKKVITKDQFIYFDIKNEK